MKKLLVTIFALIYLGTSSGAIMHLHFCMGKLAETSFSNESSKNCSKCGMKKTQKKAGCCKDQTKFVKNNSDQKAGSSLIEFNNFESALEPIHSLTFSAPVCTINPRTAYSSHAPPGASAPAIYLRVCSFLI